MSVRIVKDLRALFGLPRDQDQRPTCMAFAASDAHAGVRDGWDPLSVEWAYYHAIQREGGGVNSGVSLRTMLNTIREDGQPVEAEWPYIAPMVADASTWKPPRLRSPAFTRDSALLAASVDNIIKQVHSGCPVLFTMSVSRAFYMPSADGVISGAEPLEPKRVHALVAVGRGTQNGTDLILVRNSWGEGWGMGGHAWIDVNYLKPRLRLVAVMAGEL